MPLFDTVEDWFLNVALKKGAARLAVFVAARVAASKLEQHGVAVRINPDVLAGSILTAVHLAADWLKTKGWLPHWAA